MSSSERCSPATEINKNFLLIAIGSAGDVNPFIGIGAALRSRGHAVTIAANEHFKSWILAEGLSFEPLGTEAEFEAVLNDPDLWHPLRGFHAVARALTPKAIHTIYDVTVRHARDRSAVVAGSCLALGARIAQDHLGIPVVSIHLQPALFRSVIQPPHLAFRIPDWVPRSFVRWTYRAAQVTVDRALAAAVNAVRRDVGLAPIQAVMDWWDSPFRIIGLFPEWLARPQTDWPPQTRLTGFPLYDADRSHPVDSALENFVKSGPPPVVFTPGSAMNRSRSYFAAALDGSRRIGARAVFVTPFRDQLPRELPSTVYAAPYVPFARLLSSAAAFVHHGGIGTTAQALAAGVPQLVVPWAHDQFDNADRVARLGVARVVALGFRRWRRFRDDVETVVRDPSYAREARQWAARINKEEALVRTCEALEAVA